MNDNLQPLGNDPLEARITAWVLGEASPFEAAELEALCEKDPELKLFLHRTTALHALIKDAETTSNAPSDDWKLPAGKKIKLARLLDDQPEIPALPKPKRDLRRLTIISAFAIAACITFAAFLVALMSPDFYRQHIALLTEGRRQSAPTTKQSKKELTAADIHELKKAIRDQEDRVEEHRKTLTTISRTKKLIYWDKNKSAAQSDFDEKAKEELNQYAQLDNERNVLESQINNLQNFDDEQLMVYASGLDIPDNLVKSLFPQQLQLEREIAGLKASGLAQIHPDIKSKEKNLEIMNSQLEEATSNLRDRLQGQLDMTKEQLAIVESRREGTRQDALDKSIDTQDYFDAKRSYETDLALLEQMKLKLLSAEIDTNISNEQNKPAAPTNSMAKVITANAPDPTSIPVPEIAVAESTIDFGEGKDFGGGWGGHEFRSGDAAINYNAVDAILNNSDNASSIDSPVVHLGGQVRKAGPIIFEEGLTLSDAISRADGSTEFGSRKRVKVTRNGKTTTYDLDDKDMANIEIHPDDVIEIPQKAIFPSGSEIDDLAKNTAENAPQPPTEVISGSLAQREIVRRENGIQEADEKLLNGRDAYAKGDYAGALENYKKALENLPDTPATEERRQAFTEHLNDASIARAQELRKIGKYEEARELLYQAEITAPDDNQIKQEIAYLDDPIRTNPALTYEHTKQVDEVRRNLYMAQGNYDLGKYDAAKKSYEDILRIDQYNTAARRGMEKIAAAKSDYYRAAYDHTRAEMLMQVDKAWELSVPADEGEKDTGLFGDNLEVKLESLAYTQKLELPHLPETGKSGYAWWTGNESAKANSDPTQSDLFFAKDAFNASKAKSTITAGWKMDLAEHVTGYTGEDEFDGFVNYGAPIAREPEGFRTTTRFQEVTQANDDELEFDWVVSPFASASEDHTSLTGMLARGEPSYLQDRFDTYTGYLFQSNIRAGGQRNDISIIREFEYPTEYEAPELPDTLDLGLMIPVTPATPTAFESEDVGALMEALPVVGRLFQPKQPTLIDLSEEIPATQEPFSTFSLNISDASFQLALAAVEKGERPDPASIKPEQFYNAVDYGDPAPSTQEPVAAAIDQTAHPVIPGRNLVRVAIRTASTGRSAAQPLRLTLLVDQSGSMARDDRRAALDAALAQLATLLRENDRITVIGFSRTPRLIADSLPGNEASKLPNLINTTASEGGTNLQQALHLASELALRHHLKGAQNRIVLFTDGAANLGDADPEILSERIKELRQQNLAFDIAGIGTNDTNDRLLSELARHGDGRYYLVDENTGTSLATQLAGAFRPAAENVKIQVKLNPERVGNYKLIGFEKDRLKTEDFRNDSVDAAELAADEAGVAIYQVETLPEGIGEIGEVSVRFRDTASGEMVERSWTIPHDPSAPAFDKADTKTQLATLALLAAQKLQGGPMADAINFNDYMQTIVQLKQSFANDSKAQRLFTLIDALK